MKQARDVFPSFKEFKAMARRGNVIPVYREILADRDTPVSIFEKLTRTASYACLLESIEGGERWGRYSIIAPEPSRIIRLDKGRITISKNNRIEIDVRTGNPLVVLKTYLKTYRPVDTKGLPRFWGGIIGYLGYDLVRTIEDIPDRHKDEDEIPDGLFMVTGTVVIFDHVSHRVKIVACVETGKGGDRLSVSYRAALSRIESVIRRINRPSKPPRVTKRRSAMRVTSNVSKRAFTDAVRAAKAYIRSGEIIQTVISQRFSTDIRIHPFEVYRALRIINPSPYLFYLRLDGTHLVGSSPEILVRKEGDRVELRPIAGTRKRGKSMQEDNRLERELLSDPKELAEHVMLVDLARNDLGRVCRYNSVQLPETKVIERYSHVMHIVSSVKGLLKPGMDAVDLLRAVFPAGTVSGAPKIRAMEIIDELETCRRGPYAGAVGYFSFNGNMDMAITIRTIVVRGRTAWVQAGAGIVADSVPEKEYIETRNKAAALLEALRMAEKGLW